MTKNGYIVTRSNYTEKKKHKQLPNSDIYERDYMTTTNLGGWDSGSIPYGEGNFKIITKDVDNTKRKHKYGNWLLNENCTDETPENCEYFTLGNIPNPSDVTTETKIESKPNRNSLLDYVYYGNCEELINTSIEHIIANYPGELYVTDQTFDYLDENGNLVTLGTEGYVVISNPFEIDIVSQTNTNDENHLRYFCDSANLYTVIDISGDTKNIVSWDVTQREKNIKCPFNNAKLATIVLTLEDNSTLTIEQRYLSGAKFLLTEPTNAGLSIRPKYNIIDGIFSNTLDDFDNFLLNRDSHPLYKIDIDTPSDTDEGVIVVRKSYAWPTIYGWNLDIESNDFKRYYDELIELAKWYDENRTNNLWRNMTHESIRNMDRTVMYDQRTDENRSDYLLGKGNLYGLLLAYGRQFDEIKRSIKNIGTTNTVTYNENNNTPDYFMTDQLNMSGWEVKSVTETLVKDTKVSGIYNGDDREYVLSDANLIFSRNLKLNSKAIFTRKGTKQSVEMVLSLFGYKSYDWAKKYYEALSNNKKPKRGRRPLNFDEIPSGNVLGQYDYKLDEYVATVTNTVDDVIPVAEELPIEKYNSYKLDYNDQDSTVQGLPVRLIEVTMLVDDAPVQYKYIIPWFDKEEELDGSPYFQMYGGWEKTFKKTVVPNKEFYPNVTEIHELSGFTVFNETKKYLKVVETIDSLVNVDPNTLNENDVFYVNDITDIENYDSGVTISGATNYFIIKDVSNAFFCGLRDDRGEGWRNIPKEELSCENGPTPDAYRVIYLENIIEESKGNNPHVGYAKYDNGETYIDYFRQLFKGAIENDLFGDDAYDCVTGEILDEIKNTGFNLTESVDNVKTWYFTDTTNESNVYLLKSKIVEAVDDNGDEYDIQNGYEKDEDDITNVVNVGYEAYTNHEVGFSTELNAFDLEKQENNSNDEAAANSIINTKKLVLTFNDELANNKEFHEYFNTCMLPYIEQIVPSTTIFEINLGRQNG